MKFLNPDEIQDWIGRRKNLPDKWIHCPAHARRFTIAVIAGAFDIVHLTATIGHGNMSHYTIILHSIFLIITFIFRFF